MMVAGVTFVRLVRVLESPLGSGRPADVSEEPQWAYARRGSLNLLAGNS